MPARFRSLIDVSLKRLNFSLVASTVLAAILVGVAFWFVALQQNEHDRVRHTLEVRNQIAQVVTLIQRAESGQRGYLFTGRELYLTPYEAAAEAIPRALGELEKLVADNPAQQDAVRRLRQFTADKLLEVRSTIELKRSGDNDRALSVVNSDTGQNLMDEIRTLVGRMEQEENGLLQQRQATQQLYGVLLESGAALAFMLICASAVLGGMLTRRSFAAIEATHRQLVDTNEELLKQISQRETAESQLRQAQKMEAIGQLSGGIAHDFNNMLAVISGSLELMKRRITAGDFNIDRQLGAALEAAKRSASLTQRLLAFARRQPLAPQPIDANRMMANMSDLLRSTLGEQIRIETVNAGGLWSSRADPHQLENAILNIAINARDAMPGGGRLTIETANAYLDEAYARDNTDVEPGQYVMVAITDTGTGMSAETVGRVFDPFFTTKPAGTGTGLGLSQVFGFVKQSHGHVKIYSELGAGTTIKIYLPRFMGEAAPPNPSAAAPVSSGNAREVILVVEDDELMRRTTTESLTALGYTALDAESAAQALAVLELRNDIALLFTDVVMPEVNGKTLADEALRRRPDLKVIYTTGYTPNAVVHGGVLDPGVQLLSKPFTLEQLATKVRTVLDKQNA
jgi:signal transduction histidine kinase/ActR/RegA family two-component response regulator